MAQDIILSEEYRVPSKTEIAKQVEQVTAQVEDGNINPLRAYGLLVALEKVISEAKKSILELAIKEAEKYPEKEIGAYGAKFQIKEAGVKYDYSQDGEWQSYQDQIEEIRARQKGRETTLQALKQCAKSSTTTLQVTLNK